MESIRSIYRIGKGPSSSHTMGPRKAAEQFLEKYPDAYQYRVTLFGSLAATGKGHLTDKAVTEVFINKKLELIWRPDKFLPKHPNALTFETLDRNGNATNLWTAYSIGGGAIVDENTKLESKRIYSLTRMDEILTYCKDNSMELWEFVEENEGESIWQYMEEVWEVMKNAIAQGMENEGILPGELQLKRKASHIRTKTNLLSGPTKNRTALFSYALAVSEQNAGGGTIVTAPTCGACGTLPAVLYYQSKAYKPPKRLILRALATAGLIGNIVKWNASISGAEAGCQAEIGTACAMASAAATQLLGGDIFQIEYAAEMGLEHHLGLTCDPLYGLVQVPCIERNAFGASRAVSHASFALMTDGRHIISFDQVVETMKQTGFDLPSMYRETSLGGLALYGVKK